MDSLTVIFQRLQLLFIVLLLSNPYGNLCIHIKVVTGLFNSQLFRAFCLLQQLLKGQLQQQFISPLPPMTWSCEHFISDSPTQLQAQGFQLMFLVPCGNRWIISSCVFCCSTYMYILFSGSLKSIYEGSLIDLVSTCYLQWKCRFFFAEVVFNSSPWSSQFFIKSRLSYMSEKQMYGYKQVQRITSISFFLSSNFSPLHNDFVLIENYSQRDDKVTIKFECSSCCNEFNQT